MAKPSRGGLKRSKAQEAPAGRRPRPDIVHSSVYLPEAVYEALREAAFKERVKIHDIVLEGIGAALKRRGYPSIEELVSGKKR
jgi:hypothetical protein